MKFIAQASLFALSFYLPAALGLQCKSGLDHSLGTSCHGDIGQYACSDASRRYIVCALENQSLVSITDSVSAVGLYDRWLESPHQLPAGYRMP